jgi:hypothetical protein
MDFTPSDQQVIRTLQTVDVVGADDPEGQLVDHRFGRMRSKERVFQYCVCT